MCRAQLGLLAAQAAYPPHIAHARLEMSSESACSWPRIIRWSKLPRVRQDDLSRWRLLRLSSVAHDDANDGRGCSAAADAAGPRRTT